jgi:hypothetical protein
MRITLQILHIMPEHEEYRQDVYATLSAETFKSLSRILTHGDYRVSPLRHPSRLIFPHFRVQFALWIECRSLLESHDGVMNISALLRPAPLLLRRHLLVNCLLGVFPKSHDQWIEFNGRAKAYVNLRDPEVRNVFLQRSFKPGFLKLASAVLSEGVWSLIAAPILVRARLVFLRLSILIVCRSICSKQSELDTLS